ncbi:MAG: 8-oxoguanine deaminase [Betaproteobacteria bacterium]|nr:8-oxoguanine deaminase [Betaproteobacteria bacterium]
MTGRSVLLGNASVVVTMDDARREIRDGAVLVADNVIEAVGTSAELAGRAVDTIDLSGHLLCPGLVNTHHHFYQTLTRALPAAQDAELFTWLKTLYPIWARLTPEMARVSALTAMAELVLSGCTTSSDHLYLYPNGVRLDDTIDAAREIGMRFHATRGAMSLGESRGGLPPDALVEEEGAILADMRRVIERFHDSSRYATLRVALAPCSPFSVSRDLMREAAALARAHGVGLHTHLAENDNDVAFTREQFGCTPAEYCEELGWLGPDVWHAHCVKLDEPGILRFGATRTGVAHCPSSNMRLASGIAPVRRMRDADVSVGLGVDGAASNDGGHMLAEARQAMLLQRVAGHPAALSGREALEIATIGGAKVLGRDDIGALAPGMAADIAGFRLDQIGLAGALHDPVAALVFCAPTQAAFSMINGRVVLRDGVLTTVDVPVLVERHNRLAAALLDG